MNTPGSTSVSDGVISKRQLRRKVALKNYDEKLMDEFIERHLGGPLKKKHRTMESIEKETETEAMIAISLGFPIDALIDEEIKAGVVSELGGKEQNDYIVLRNHILSRWRANVGVWLSKEQIKETTSSDVVHLMSTAYDFLLYNGFINFGVSMPFSSQIPEEASEGSVVIIGAGFAGLAAARQLLSFGYKVIVLEGRNRPGGRVYTHKMGNNEKFSAVELGGSVITGIHANPLGVLARQLSIPLHKVRDKCPLYKPDGSEIDKEIDSKVESTFNRLLDKVTELRKIMGGFANDVSLGFILDKLRELYSVAKTKEESELLDWHLANLEYANAGCLSELSGTYWDQDDPYEMGGDHCFLAGGNWRLIRALCEGVPILYEKTVHTIRYGIDGVEVLAGDQTFQADIVLCTLPLGVLKRKTVTFEPELPKRKLDAINRLGFGLLNKVAMVFPYVFWGEDLDTFGRLSNHSHKRGEFFLFYGYHTVAGGAVLVALVAGEAARDFEQTNPSVLLHRVLEVLRGIYNPKGVDVPNPIQTVCTRWGSDPLSYGSYSHVRVGSTGTDYDILAENVGDRLFFAGEATTRKYPATMHGAFLSGLREAGCIFRTTRAQQSNGKRYGQKPFGSNFDTLPDLFKRPDLVLGNFMFILGPFTEDQTSLGLLRVSFEGSSIELCIECTNLLDRGIKCHEHSCLPLELYGVVSREQVEQLQQVDGDDRDRLSFLFKNLGLKLMGPSALGALASSVVTCITTARRGKGRASYKYSSIS